jgi:hypothetical protein
MKRHVHKIAAACVLAALAGAAFAEDPDPSGQFATQVHSDLTRAQVEAQTREARKDGTLSAPGGLFTYRDETPGAYPPKPQAVAGKSRAEVKAELAAAIHNGDMLATGESGLTERQLNPTYYAAQDAAEQSNQLAATTGH